MDPDCVSDVSEVHAACISRFKINRVSVHVYILGAGLTDLRRNESRRARTKNDCAGEDQQQFTRNRPHGVKSGGCWPVRRNRDSGQENVKKAFMRIFHLHSEDGGSM